MLQTLYFLPNIYYERMEINEYVYRPGIRLIVVIT